MMLQKTAILLVDDRADNLFIFKAALKKIDCETTIVSSGTDALQKLEKQDFGLVVLDAQMPGLDGFATLQRIKTQPLLQHIPVILVTDSDPDGQASHQGYELGAVDVLVRPFHENVLRAKVATFVALHNQYQNFINVLQQKTSQEISNLTEDREKTAQSEQVLQQHLKELQQETEAERQRQAQIYQRLTSEVPEILQRLKKAKEETSLTQPHTSSLSLHEQQEDRKLITSPLTRTDLSYEIVPVQLSLIDPQSVVQDVVSLLKIKANEKSLSLSMSCDKATAGLIKSDASALRQVLLNLIHNAIEHTHQGSIKVHIFPIIAEGKEFTAFEVTDSGRGILPSHQEAIFHPPANGLRNSSLFYSRRLAQSLGGEVHLMNSYLNQGSTFLFTVANKAESAVTISAKKSSPEHHRPLIPEA